MDPDPGLKTLKNLDAENPQCWKAWETAGYRKKIVRLHSITYYYWKSTTKRLGSKPSEKKVIEEDRKCV